MRDNFVAIPGDAWDRIFGNTKTKTNSEINDKLWEEKAGFVKKEKIKKAKGGG